MNGSKTGGGTGEGALYFCGASFSAAVGRQSERQTLFRDGRLTFDQDFLLQGSPKECFPGLVNFVTAVAYHLCLNLPTAVLQPKSV